jgi:tetratricopeptide (TPR) repeat protein
VSRLVLLWRDMDVDMERGMKNVGADKLDVEPDSQGLDSDEAKPSRSARRLTSVEHFKESTECSSRGDMDKAILHALHSLEGAVQRPRHYENLARLLYDARMPSAAETVARRAIALGFDQPFIHLQLGRALFARKSYEAAIETLDSAIERGVDDIRLRRYRDTLAKRLEGIPLGDSAQKQS